MRKKILHIIPSLVRGGAETLLCNSLKMMHEYTHIVIVFNKSDDDIQCDANVISLDCCLPRDLLKARKILKDIVKREKPDIIHSHLYWANILSRLIKASRIKKIQQYHSNLYDKSNTAQYSLKMLMLDKLTYRPKYKLVFVSEFLREKISKQIGAKRNTFVIYNFVPDHFFELHINKIEANEIQILNVANLRPEKNQEVLLKAMRAVRDYKVFARIAGEGIKRYDMEEFLKENHLRNTKLLGRREDISMLIRESNLFITTSLYEGFGISLIEAMAAGLPCIASNIPVFREIGGSSLIYFDPTNPEDLAKKILTLQDSNIRKNFGKKARQQALNFTEEKYSNKIRNLYKHLII